MSNQSQLTFRGQREDETLISLIHRHPWALAKAGFIIGGVLVLVILMFVYFKASAPSIWSFFVLGLGVAIYGAYSWFIWWNNLYLITDQRIISISQRGLWSRRIEDYALDKIQSVASDSAGIAGTLLNFGTVQLAIMGIKEPVSLPFIEDQYAIQEQILSTRNAFEAPGVRIREYNKPKKRVQL
jgi:hypothetical protein